MYRRNIAMERQAGSHDESFRRIPGGTNPYGNIGLSKPVFLTKAGAPCLGAGRVAANRIRRAASWSIMSLVDMSSMFRKDTCCFIGLGPMGREADASCILMTTQRSTPCSSSRASSARWRRAAPRRHVQPGDLVQASFSGEDQVRVREVLSRVGHVQSRVSRSTLRRPSARRNRPRNGSLCAPTSSTAKPRTVGASISTLIEGRAGAGATPPVFAMFKNS